VTAPSTVTGPRRRAGIGVAGGVAASAAVIAGLTVLSRLTGFGRQLVFSGTVGAACVGDAYNTANLLPTVLFEVAAGGALAATLVPLLAPSLPGRPQNAERVASGLLTWTLLALAPLAVLLHLLADPIAALLVSRAECTGQRELVAAMIRVFAPQVLLYGAGAVLAGLLQATGRFAWPAFAPVLSSVVVMGGYLGYGALVGGRASTITGAALPGDAFAVLAWATTAGVAAMTLPLLVPVTRAGFRLRPTLALPVGVGARALRLAGSGVLAVLAQQGFQLVVVALANHRGRPGTLVAFGYTQALSVLPHAVLVAPLVTAFFPRLAQAAADRSSAGANDFAALTARAGTAVLLAGAAGGALLAATAPGVAGLFAALDRGHVGPMATALTLSAPGLAGFALMVFAGRALYAIEAPGAAAAGASTGWIGAALAATVAVAAVAPSRALGALATGNTIGMIIGAVALLLVLRRRAGRGSTAGLVRASAVVLPAAVGSGGLGWWLARGLSAAWGPGLVSSVLIAVVAAVVTAIVFALATSRVVLDLVDPLPYPPSPPLASATGDGVLLVLGPSGGGIGRHVRELAEELRAAGRPVAVAAPPATVARFGFAEAGLRVAPVVIGERPHPLRDLAAVRRLRRLTHGAAVVHAHGLRAGALAVLACGRRSGRIPVVVTVHNAPPVGGGVAATVYRLLERVVARRAAAVLVVSGDLADRMRAVGARQVDRALVPAPLPHPAEGQSRASRRVLRAEFGVGEDELLLVTAARLAPQKGLEVLLDAVAALTAAGTSLPALPIRAVIAGDGPLAEPLAEVAAQRNLPVRLLGRRPDVPHLFAAADLAVVPSLWEGQPLVVQEALAAGAAIVATDAGGTGEVTGDAAVLVPPGDARALAAAIRELAADPGRREELRRRAVIRAGDLPTAHDALAQVVAVYRRVTADRLESRGAAHT